MMVTRWNDKGWKDAGAELRRWKKMDVPTFVRHRGRVLDQDLLRWTPPRGKRPGSESWPSMKKRGEKTVERDCKRLFIPIRDVPLIKDALAARETKVSGVRVRSLHSRIKALFRAQNWNELERLLFKLGFKYSGIIGNASEQVHDRAVREGSRGRPARHKRYLVIEKSSIAPLISKLKSHVGRLKSGWGAAARALGVPARNWPAWVQRHGANGSFQDRTSVPDRPTLIFINNDQASKDMSQAEIVDAAIAVNERKMVIEAQKIWEHEQRKLQRAMR